MKQYYLVVDKSEFDANQFRLYIQSLLKKIVQSKGDNEQFNKLIYLYDRLVIKIENTFKKSID